MLVLAEECSLKGPEGHERWDMTGEWQVFDVSCCAAGGARRLVARPDGRRKEDHDALQGVQRGPQERAGEATSTRHKKTCILHIN